MKPVGNASVMRKSKKMHKTSGMNPTLIVDGKISLFLVGPNGVIFSKKIVKNQMAPYQRDTAASRFVDHDSMSVLWQLSFFHLFSMPGHIMKSVVMTHHAQFSDACVFWWACNFCWNACCPVSFSSSVASWNPFVWKPKQDLNMDKTYNYKFGIMHQMSCCSPPNHSWNQTCREKISARTYRAQCHAGKKKVISTKYTLHSMQLNVLSHNSRHGPPPNLTTFSTPHTFIFPSLEVGHGNKNLDKWTKQDRHNLKSTVTCIRYKVSEYLHWNLDETIKLRLTPFFLFRFFLDLFRLGLSPSISILGQHVSAWRQDLRDQTRRQGWAQNMPKTRQNAA